MSNLRPSQAPDSSLAPDDGNHAPDAFIELPSTSDTGIAELIALLEPALSQETILKRIAAMRAEHTQFFGIRDSSAPQRKLIGTAAMSFRTHCFAGLVAFVENVVIVPSARQGGLGERFMRWLEAIAWQQGCEMVTLDAYQRNLRARAFYERLGYDPRGVHFVLERPADHPPG
jgi:N-acetylglutamate synthase-like GNAT family acetyltransferase